METLRPWVYESLALTHPEGFPDGAEDGVASNSFGLLEHLQLFEMKNKEEFTQYRRTVIRSVCLGTVSVVLT